MSGHYICDSVHPGIDPAEASDRWLTFNDSQVYETSGSDICKERQRSAYILFYKKQVGRGRVEALPCESSEAVTVPPACLPVCVCVCRESRRAGRRSPTRSSRPETLSLVWLMSANRLEP